MSKLKSLFTIKRIILAFAIILALLCLACICALAARHRNKLKRFNNAVQAFDNGDYESAKTLFAKCLYDQYNSEEVNKRLALIAEYEKNWPQAVIYWQQTASLNPFKSDEYMPRQLNALKMMRNFPAIVTMLTVAEPKGGLSQEQLILLAYAYLKTDRLDSAKETFAKVTDKDALQSPLGQFMSFSLDDKKRTVQEVLDFLQQFHDNKDPFIAFETLFSSANQYAFVKDMKKGKDCMARAVALNPIIGKPLQGDYLYALGAISEAIPILEECTASQTPPLLLASLLGECYTITNQPVKLKELAAKCKTGSRERLITGYYLEALHAYLTNNDKALIENIALCESYFMSSIAMLVKLQAATRAQDVEATKRLLKQIMEDRNYANFKTVAGKMGMQFVFNLVSNNQAAQAAVIAQQLFDRSKPDLLLARLIVGAKTADGSLTQSDIDYFEKTFPNDFVILLFIARNHLKKNNFQAAIQTARTNLDTHANSDINLSPVKIELLNAQEALKQYDDAKATALNLLSTAKADIGTNLFVLDFFFKHGFKDELKSYPDKVKDMDSEDFAAMKKLAMAQAAFIEKQNDQIPALLDGIGNPQPAVLFQIAILFTMAQHFDKANEIYQKIIDGGHARPAIYLNMSENCHALKQKDQAFKYAKLAREQDPDNPITNEMYAVRLFETGLNQEEAFRILDGLITRKTITEAGAKAWYQLMLWYRMKELYDQKKWHECMAEAKRVLSLAPKDENAQKVYDAAEKELKAEEAKKAEASKEEDDKVDAALQEIQKKKEEREQKTQPMP